MERLIRGVGAIVLALACSSVAAIAADPSAGRVVAIGDIHGDFDAFVSILQEAGLVDAERRWSGGGATLVQTGDFLDRGAQVRQVMDLLMALESEAAEAGGRVVVLLGNHEGFAVLSVARDVNPEAYVAFADARSEARQKAAYRAHRRFARQSAEAQGLPPPAFTREAREAWKREHPPGFVEYQEALGPSGKYGKWLRGLPAVVRIGDTLFLHGGIAPELAGHTLDEINARVRADIGRFDSWRQKLVAAGRVPPFATASEILAAARLELHLRRAAIAAIEAEPATEEAAELARLESWLDSPAGWLNDPQGPLWFRGYANWSEEEGAALLPPILEAFGVARIVAAHTPQQDGRITARFDGGVFLIDTGMLSSYYAGGSASALEIAGGTIVAIYPRTRVTLVDTSARPRLAAPKNSAAAAALAAVLASVAEAAPEPEETAHRWLGPDGEPLPFGTDDEVLEFLATAEVVGSKEIGAGITKPLRLDLEQGGIRMRAIFRYGDVRDFSVHLRGRRYRHFRDSYVFEKAAYELARLLGIDRVPPVVLRTVDRKDGSVQVWIEDATMEKTRREEGLAIPDRARWEKERQLMRVFDALIYNLDRNQTNILYGPDWTLWFIDHTRSFRPEPDLLDANKIFRCERRFWERLTSTGDAAIRETLAAYLDNYQISGLLRRRKRLVSRIQRLIDRRGEESVLFTFED